MNCVPCFPVRLAAARSSPELSDLTERRTQFCRRFFSQFVRRSLELQTHSIGNGLTAVDWTFLSIPNRVRAAVNCLRLPQWPLNRNAYFRKLCTESVALTWRIPTGVRPRATKRFAVRRCFEDDFKGRMWTKNFPVAQTTWTIFAFAGGDGSRWYSDFFITSPAV